MPRSSPAVLAAACLSAFACGKGAAPGSCQHNFDCPAGEACVSGKCQAAPCGGCQPDEACGSDGKCVAAQGASCADHTCPTAYPCNSGGVCAKPCLTNSDCDPGLFCNSALKSCTQCAFDSQCSGKKDTPVCNTDTGMCAACNVNFDCVKALGSGHFCDAHVCKVGCKSDTDCNATVGETCDLTTTPGKCVQCHQNSDCAAQGPNASACDDTGHCVQCWGKDQASANLFCSTGTKECNLTLKTCVQCLPTNNQCGFDCGYPVNGLNGAAWGCPSTATDGFDPHFAKTCNGDTYTCVDGCQFDSQCGCPHDVLPGYGESNCSRFPDQEHCDPNRTTMAGVTGPTKGACVQCTQNTHCEYKIAGSTQYQGHYANLNGARCVNDSCVEGCDTDADCYPDHNVPATNAPKYCNLTTGAATFHQCVQCHCDPANLSADGTFCETDALCAATGKVCDATSLTCRKRRFGEQCGDSTQCGDTKDPLLGANCSPSSLCILNSDPQPLGATQYCAPDHTSYGRCGFACDDLVNNKYCSQLLPCPAQSQCRPARDGVTQNSQCVPASCNNP